MASMILMFAWCGMKSAMSSAVTSACSSTRFGRFDGHAHGPAEDLASLHVDVAPPVAVQDRA